MSINISLKATSLACAFVLTSNMAKADHELSEQPVGERVILEGEMLSGFKSSCISRAKNFTSEEALAVKYCQCNIEKITLYLPKAEWISMQEMIKQPGPKNFAEKLPTIENIAKICAEENKAKE